MILDDVFSLNEIKKLETLGDCLKIFHVEDGDIFNKSLSYHLQQSPFRSIIKPKLDKILGEDHVVGMSAYKVCNSPYILHFDTRQGLTNLIARTPSLEDFSSTKQKYNTVILIPLVEGPNFRTTIFEIDCVDDSQLSPSFFNEKWLHSSNNLNPDDYDHLPSHMLKDLNRLPLLEELTWKLGSVIIWERSKLHCSSNFAKFGLIKKMIVLFVD